jgi:hypothetical protein
VRGRRTVEVRVERLSRAQNKAADPARKDMLLTFVAAGFRAVLQSGSTTTQSKSTARKARTR